MRAKRSKANHLLTSKENRIAKLICKGAQSHEIQREEDITYNTLGVHLTNIRRKTGIRNLRDGRLRQYLFDDTPVPVERKVTPMQLAVMELIASGVCRRDVATRLGITLGSVYNLASAGYSRLGVKGVGYERLIALRVALANLSEGVPSPTPPGMDDPMFS